MLSLRFARRFSSSAAGGGVRRNIGIIAHIDAGKTTVSERMLYYAKHIDHMGEVHDGDTVLDFMRLERERGITIGAAAVSFGWRNARINLLDTPGHIDFTVEVERSVRVLDGAVAVFDGVAGVQAQSVTVWRQAARYAVPAVAFVNKLDREGASLRHAVQTIDERLGVRALPLQVPLGAESRHLNTIADVLSLRAWHWRDEQGDELDSLPLFSDASAQRPSPALLAAVGTRDADSLLEQVLAARASALELLAERASDSAFLDAVFGELGGGARVDDALLRAAVRQQVLAPRVDGVAPILPVLCGSALKKRGVQPLLDAVVDFLPAPHERVADAAAIGPASGPLRALAFKVVHDHQRGPVVWLRVLSGTIRAGDRVLNISRVDEQSPAGAGASKLSRARRLQQQASKAVGVLERAHRLMQLDADDAIDIKEAHAGDIVAAVGLRRTATGDTLVSEGGAALAALDGVRQQPQVFSCSIEPVNSGQQQPLDDALAMLRLEDPSFAVSTSRDSGQLLISGMGKLHLEIVVDRLAEHYRVPVQVGDIYISYRSTPSRAVSNLSFARDVRVSNALYHIATSLSLEPADDELRVELPSDVSDAVADAIERGVQMGAAQGVIAGFPLMRFAVTVHSIAVTSASSHNASGNSSKPSNSGNSSNNNNVPAAMLPSIEACVSAAVLEAARQSDVKLLEPMMRVDIELSDAQFFGAVVADLTNQRRGSVEEVTTSPTTQMRNVRGFAPLKELVSYSNALRSISKGTAAFVMEVSHYDTMPKQLESAVLADFGIVAKPAPQRGEQ
jgi:elongation factor G